jgi:hypothetical protein
MFNIRYNLAVDVWRIHRFGRFVMTVARSQLVDVSVTPWYHVISKTVRGAFLLRDDGFDRKQWIEDRLELLARVFAIAVASFSVLDSHLHILVCLDPGLVKDWSDEEVTRRWLTIYPPRGANRKPLEVTPEIIRETACDAKFVAKARRRLGDLGWFMKSLKEPLARKANQVDGKTGAFWQSRYKSVAVLDTQALLATSAYIDLNVLAAGLVQVPEESPHTSIRTRIEHCRQEGRLDDLRASDVSSVAGVQAARGCEDALWLCPIEDRRQRDAGSRRGMLDVFSLGSYLQLVDWTSRLARKGKARVSQKVQALLDRLGTTANAWEATMGRLFSTSRHTGVAFAFNRDLLREEAHRRRRHHVANFSGCPT